MEEPTLGTALNRIILLTLLLVGLVTGAYIFGYSRIKQTLSNQAMEESLIRSSGIQTEALLISFLVPEQRTGVPVMLARFKEQDQLDEVRVISSEEELTSEFKGCKLLINSTQRCLSTDKKKFAVIIPISVEGNTFGYLFKAKQIPDLFENDFLLLMMEATAGVMILSFLFLFLFLGRVTSHEVPEDLARLAQWIDDLLGERCPEQMPRLKFKELNDLGNQITEIIRRHEKVSDQATVGQLTSGIMHDIKTPLHSIVTALHLAAEQPENSPKRFARLENLFRVCSANLPIIGSIIESTLDSNRDIHIDPIEKNVYETLSSVISMHRTMADQRQVQIEFKGEKVPLHVKHDPVQMSRVFSNILKNSLEAFDCLTTDHERKILISVWERDRVCISFEDTGPGLPDNPERVFRAFRSSKLRGSGLGLMVSRKIVEAHLGKIIPSRSELLGGARFEIFLNRGCS